VINKVVASYRPSGHVILVLVMIWLRNFGSCDKVLLWEERPCSYFYLVGPPGSRS